MKSLSLRILLIIPFFLGCQPKKEMKNIKNSSTAKMQGLVSTNTSDYLQINKIPDDSLTKFNHRALSQELKAYKVYIRGLDINLNQESALGAALKDTLISELHIEADTVNVLTSLHFAGTNLFVTAKRINFYKGAQIDLTPDGFGEENRKIPNGIDGMPGLPGSQAEVVADEIFVEGQQPIIIANGGEGQNAGASQPGIAGTKVIPFDPKTNMLGKERYEYNETIWCSGDLPFGGGWKTKCGSVHTVYEAKGTFVWPTNGGDAVAGGAPGPGGAGGMIHILNSAANVDLRPLLVTESGKTGQIAADAKGGDAGTPMVSKINRVKANGTDKARYEEEVHTALAGKDAVSPKAPRTVSLAGTVVIEKDVRKNYSDIYFAKKMQWIKDLYLAGQYEKTKKELDGTLKVLAKSDLAEGAADSSILYYRSLFQQLKMNLELQRDYFGDELSKAPL